MIWIYDIETYFNYFSVIFKNPKSQEIKEFIIFEDTNNIDELYQFINDYKKWLIGYNSFNFDNQLLNFIYKRHGSLTFEDSDTITKEINNLANLIISNDFSDYKYGLPFRFLDLMKIGNYKKSLKLLAVSMKWHKIQDLPINSNNTITKEDVNIIHNYNLNDVLITEKLYEHLYDSIKLRVDLSNIYKVNAYSESDSGLANRLLEKFYSETTGLPLRDFKNLRTERNFVKFDWVVFNTIDFNTNAMIHVLEDIKEHIYYKNQPFYKKTFVFDNIKYKIGIGGLHSMDTGAIFESNNENNIVDADIQSMYPNIIINHKLTPEHLGSRFLIKYKQIKNTRLEAKKNNRITENESLKIVLNSAYGKLRSKYSWLYDPLVALQVTINGQLYVLMLIESLVEKGFKVISANTDGIITIVPKNKRQLYNDICKQWMGKTRLILEYTEYKRYIRRDVNNYIAIKNNDDIKTKGIFIKDSPKKFSNQTDPLNKGWDKPIISIALYEFFVNNIPIQETITDHTDIYNFCIAKKIDKKFTNEYHYMKNGKHKVDILQKSVRYYVSKYGGKLIKTNKEENKVENYEVNKMVTIFNNYIKYNNFKDYNINYNYYIHNTQKIIDEIIKPQLTLF